MEFHVLKNFLQIARDGNMTRAAEFLHISQPTLSKQMKYLEQELGKKLFRRSANKMLLTDEGMLLRKRAEDIIDMVDKTTAEFKDLDRITGGNIHIGCAESNQIQYLAEIIQDFKCKYPDLRHHILSGTTEQVTERLDRGLLDFAVIVEPPNLERYNYLTFPQKDTWGVLMRADCHLAQKSGIHFEDLENLPLLVSAQAMAADIPRWCGEKADTLNFIGTMNLFFNGTMFVRQGSAYMLTFDHLADTREGSDLCFRPLEPTLETQMYLIWKKYQVFSPIAELLLEQIKKYFSEE